MIPNTDHNEALAGDNLYSVSFNFQWREIIVGALTSAMARLAATIDDDTERDAFDYRVAVMFEDFYDSESVIVSEFDIGDLKIIPHSTIPADWMLCDGSAISRTTYDVLFDKIGTSYGVGDNSTTFNLPDLRGRTVIGAGTGTDLSPRTLAANVGAETHQLTSTEMPSHTHNIARRIAVSSPSNNNVAPANNGALDFSGSQPISSAGGDTPHNNMQPSLVLNYIIKVQ